MVVQSLRDTGLRRPIIGDVLRRELMALRSHGNIPDTEAALSRIPVTLVDV